MTGNKISISGIPALLLVGVPWLVGVIWIIATLYRGMFG